MIIDPKKKNESFTNAPLNCYDNYTVWQKITFDGINTDKQKYPWGLPLVDVGKFILCVRRYSMTNSTINCQACRKETTVWSNNIKGDKRYSDLVGGFKAFMDKRLSTKTTMFTIRGEDVIVNNKIEPKEEVPF